MDLENLRKKILKFNQAYEEGSPLVDDYIYDFYKKKLEILEKFETNKISNIIGTVPKNSQPHLFPILSLHHDFNIEGIKKFIKKLSKHCCPFPLIAEMKIDGISLIARYENGLLQTIKTRGDSKKGEDITHLKNYLNLPNHIFIQDLLELRFEAYIEKNIFTNTRNITTGLLMKKEIDPNLKYIKLAPHNLYSSKTLYNNYIELREIFHKLHIEPINPFKICNTIEECFDFFEEVNKNRKNLPYEIDGIVFKINEKNLQEQLGNTAKAPRHSFAIKFSNSFNITTILDIKYQISRNGNITPVANIEPTLINDRIIKKATLNNLLDLKKKKYNIGDIVQIEIAGDVIPKITKIIEKKNITIVDIKKCPFCHRLLENNICKANWNCSEQKIQKLIYFASKPALNIIFLGEQQIRFFVKENLLNYPQDFFEIKNKINKITTKPDWLAEKNLKKILDNIEKSRYITDERFYISIGLPLIGNEKAKLIAQKLNIEEFLNSSLENLNFLGKNIAKQVYEYKENEKIWIKKTLNYLFLNQQYKPKNLFSFNDYS